MKQETVEYSKRILNCLYIVIALLALNSVILIFKGSSLSSSKENTSDKSNDGSTDGYDVSMMEGVDIAKILEYFGDKSEKVVYLGRSTCSACVTFLPVLQEAQDNFGYKTLYLDIETVSEKTNDFTAFKNKLDIKYTLDMGSGAETKSFGEWYGVTPMVFIIRNGKMVAGSIGANDLETFEKFLLDNGVTKK